MAQYSGWIFGIRLSDSVNAMAKEIYKGMPCGLCLFCFRVGLETYWCDLKEEITGDFSPACSSFVPNDEAIKEYKRRTKNRS